MTSPEPAVEAQLVGEQSRSTVLLPGPVPSVSPVTPVAAALARVEAVHQLPLHEQPDLYQSVHSELQNALAAIDHA